MNPTTLATARRDTELHTLGRQLLRGQLVTIRAVRISYGL